MSKPVFGKPKILPGDASYDPPACAHTGLVTEVYSEAGKKIGYACGLCRAPLRSVAPPPPKVKRPKPEQLDLYRSGK